MRINQPVKHLPTADALNIEESKQFKEKVVRHDVHGKPLKISKSEEMKNVKYNDAIATISALLNSEYIPKPAPEHKNPTIKQTPKFYEDMKNKDVRNRGYFPTLFFSH
jgi:hypothetical protein